MIFVPGIWNPTIPSQRRSSEKVRKEIENNIGNYKEKYGGHML
jgi:hypothetical protein